MSKSTTSSIWFYSPSLGASILFTILYALPFTYYTHFYLTSPLPLSQKTTYYIPLLFGTGIEISAYAIRSASTKNQASIALYAVQSSLLVVAPVFICAGLYILFGGMVRPYTSTTTANSLPGAGPGTGTEEGGQTRSRSKFKPALWMPRIFISSDILSLLMQASGSGIAGSSNWVRKEKGIGIGVLVGGLVVQVVTFSVFLGSVGVFRGWGLGTRKRRGEIEIEKEKEEEDRRVIKGFMIAGLFLLW